MTGLRFAIIADDLTGAADSGVQLVRSGYRAAVFFRGAPVDEAGLDAVALDTDSRSLSPEAARNRVYEAGTVVRSAELAYKKVDSTLRGNLREEIEAAMRATGRERVVVSPAFPAGGRTTVGGNQLLHGQPVHHTELAADPRTPVLEAHIPALLSGLGAIETLSVEELEPHRVRRALEDSRYVVADATEDGHLRALARSVPDPSAVLWVGSAGLARALAELYPGDREPAALPTLARNVLVVVGSLSRVSREQAAALVEERGMPEIELRESAAGEPEVEAAIRAAGPALARGESVVVRSSAQSGRAGSEEVAEGLAGVVAGLEPGAFGALVLTGGDTAVAVARRFEAAGIELLGEVEAGVPVGRLRGPRPYPVVTKAGGFGGRGTLNDAVRTLTGDSEER